MNKFDLLASVFIQKNNILKLKEKIFVNLNNYK